LDTTGGLYWAGDDPDHREFLKSEDSSDAHKRALIEDFLDRLRKDDWLAADKKHTDISTLTTTALDSKKSPNISGAQVTNLIEFGRAVHAEMAAFTDAARRGVSKRGQNRTTLRGANAAAHS
jgi:deoxycytidylate deaminase